jgi:hypothetical protein
VGVQLENVLESVPHIARIFVYSGTTFHLLEKSLSKMKVDIKEEAVFIYNVFVY